MCGGQLPPSNRIRLPFMRFILLTTVTVLLLWIPQASALSIIRNFTGGSAPGNTVGGGDLLDIFDRAADAWESAILDNHTVTANFGWSGLDVLGVHFLNAQGGLPNRETAATIFFDNDGSSQWFLDPTPQNHSEYLTFTESFADFGGGLINSGREFSDPIGDAFAFDLLSVATHEIGHALGLSSGNDSLLTVVNDRFQAENTDLEVDVQIPRPFAGSIIPTISGAHLDVDTSLMFPFLSPGERKLISDVDIIANAEISEFNNLTLSTPSSPIPEPSTILLLGSGLMGIISWQWKKSKTTKY